MSLKSDFQIPTQRRKNHHIAVLLTPPPPPSRPKSSRLFHISLAEEFALGCGPKHRSRVGGPLSFGAGVATGNCRFTPLSLRPLPSTRTCRWGPTAALGVGMTARGGSRGEVLIEEHGAVEGVTLDGFETGVTDDAAEFFLRGAVRRCRRLSPCRSLPA